MNVDGKMKSIKYQFHSQNYYKFIFSVDDNEMPKLVPIQKPSVKTRIGTCKSVESINTKSLQIYRKRNRNRGRNHSQSGSINYRLKPDFVNPAIVARNNFSVNAINSFMSSAMKTLGDPSNNLIPKDALRALAKTILTETDASSSKQLSVKSEEPKYDISVQKEICAIQVI